MTEQKPAPMPPVPSLSPSPPQPVHPPTPQPQLTPDPVQQYPSPQDPAPPPALSPPPPLVDAAMLNDPFFACPKPELEAEKKRRFAVKS
ncbi:hypothetical protein KIN20_014470 [Parelaphostrongylus tenuis]|uniref:Uncharacterized protein n=1 Tax=Parelaphostrongylus tenuis TaxID=148309 RepID=A0AAD5QRY2_PARTN|nr:hypothetical protein KIN20_014470 [Parelaphostrongylus tenuis]